MAFLVVSIVSLYVLSVIRSISNQVLPVNLPNPSLIERFLKNVINSYFLLYVNIYSSRVIGQHELEVSTIFGGQGYCANTAGPSQPDTESKFNPSGIEVDLKKKNLQLYLKIFQVQRQSADPHMFLKVPRSDDEEPQPQPQCFNVNAEILEKARKVIAINLVTVTLLMSFMPINIYNIMVYLSSSKPSVQSSRILGALQLPFIIMYPFLISKKLLKSINSN